MKAGEGAPKPGKSVREAVVHWAVQKVVEHRMAHHLPTNVIGDLDLQSVFAQFFVQQPADDSGLEPIMVLVVTADTVSGGQLRDEIPWNPIGVINTMTEIVQSAGGIVHA